jgi:hypothetical protein
MRCRVLTCLVLALFSAATAGCVVATARPAPVAVPAPRSGFVFLGERAVNGSVDRDRIHVGRRDGQFREIMVVVERAPVELYDVVVTFGNGERFSPNTRLVFGPDSSSRSIDLPGGPRVIRNVDFRYGNLVHGARAKVELWGR